MGKLKALKEALDMSTAARMKRAAEQGFKQVPNSNWMVRDEAARAAILEAMRDHNRAYAFGKSLRSKGYETENAMVDAMQYGEIDVPNWMVEQGPYQSLMAGVTGGQPPTLEIGDRFGKIPIGGISKNYRDDILEKGVSTIGLARPDEKNVRNDVSDMLSLAFIESDGRKKIRIAGQYVGGRGSDGEPLLLDPVELKRGTARSINAAFDPANIGKNDLLGAATVGGMATAGAVGAGLMAAQKYDFGTPEYDAKIHAFNEKRQAKRQFWKELREAGATLATAIPAGLVSDAYRVGGYLSPVTLLDETEQGAQAIQNAMTATPTGDNRFLNEMGRQVDQ